jgi:hypothetical protein
MYIDVFSEIVFIFRFGIESISLLGTDFPCGIFNVAKLISWNVIGAFGSLFSVAINKGHLFGNKLFGLSISSRSSK